MFTENKGPKTCRKCGESKPLSQFNRNAHMRDGRLNACKSCTSRIFSSYRKERLQKLLQDPALKKRVQNGNRISKRDSRRRFPQKHWARNVAYHARKRGLLQQKPCEFCGSLEVHAHHDDYTKPLDVRWLCPEHHVMVHNQQESA